MSGAEDLSELTEQSTFNEAEILAPIKEREEEAAAFKNEGNSLFGRAAYQDAIDVYKKALDLIPDGSSSDLSVLHGNISLAFLKMGSKGEALNHCNEALKYNPEYTKILIRRAALHEEAERFDEAIRDYNAVLKINPSLHCYEASIEALKKKSELKTQRLTNEVITNLKGIANPILNIFGLSTNDFKMEKDPQTGSYSIKMEKNGAHSSG